MWIIFSTTLLKVFRLNFKSDNQFSLFFFFFVHSILITLKSNETKRKRKKRKKAPNNSSRFRSIEIINKQYNKWVLATCLRTHVKVSQSVESRTESTIKM